MDNILKSKFVQMKEHFNFHLDLKNIKFYKGIKDTFNKSLFISGASGLSFLLSLWILNGFHGLFAHFLICIFFFPLFFAYLKKLNMKYPLKLTLLSTKLPGILKLFPFIRSAEDSFFFSRDKISKMLADKNCQLVFYDFFNMAKNNLFKFDEHKRFSQDLVLFKSFLESSNYLKAADYFIELYGSSHQFEYMVYDDYQNAHDLQLLKVRKKIMDEFLQQNDIDDFAVQNVKSKSIYLTKELPQNSMEQKTKPKVNWKKLMDE